MKPKIFIDGAEGTTGLQIRDRLGPRRDIELLEIADSQRKNVSERKSLINSADIVFLCLPDDAAREAVALIENPDTRVIDASTAHRVCDGWDYGFPELSDARRAAIAVSRRVANPGCHATGFLAIVYPLIALGILPRDYPLACFSLTGYSGGGKKMIARYETEKTPELSHPGIYALAQDHKHLPEMTHIAGLARAPVFSPVIDDYYSGMAVTVALHADLLDAAKSAEEIRAALAEHYAGARFVSVAEDPGEGTLYSGFGVGTNALEITAAGSDGRIAVTARFDNLGKGASGAAVQNMNLMLGIDEGTGL
ncbi:MAG: N-acetyl-gamma-glutamyl-phosphate reductase [Oscillospiraceae bacterium]|jgi:N-acetyl-gamma-glutamyl-phosphate reductase|nr:N-acetyl-gamma-glutamyl-phosphate reductase [Oscillospiraceae bacterium]